MRHYKYYSPKRRAIMAVGEKINHLEIFERDNWICGICKKPIDKALRQPNKWCATLDHIVPLCVGGFHIATNVQASHYQCNMQKGADLLPQTG